MTNAFARVRNANIMQTIVSEVLKILDSLFLSASAAALNLMRNYVAHLCVLKCRYFSMYLVRLVYLE